PVAVMVASNTSAATTTIESIEMVRMILGTRQLRFWQGLGFAGLARSFPHYSDPCHTHVAGHFITMIGAFLVFERMCHRGGYNPNDPHHPQGNTVRTPRSIRHRNGKGF